MTDRNQIPDDYVLARTTAVFDNDTVPAGLLRAHRVADGVWARLVVHGGLVQFVFEDEADAPTVVAAGETVVIPPARLHHVALDGPARFVVEFYRSNSASPEEPETAESTGLGS